MSRLAPPSLPDGWSPRLYATVVGLLVVSMSVRLSQVEAELDFPGLWSLQRWFDVDGEGNVPSWFSCVLLFLCAQTMWALSLRGADETRRWQRQERALAVVFVYLSIDELTQIHEQTIAPLQRMLDLSGALFFGWTVVAVPLTGLFALLMLGYLRALPARTGRGFVLAGLLYVGGAAGVEMIGSLLWSEGNTETLGYLLETTVEEGLEMVGLVVFLIRFFAIQTRAHRHVEFVSRNKANALSTFNLIVSGQEDPAVRAQVASVLAQAVFKSDDGIFSDASSDSVTIVERVIGAAAARPPSS